MFLGENAKHGASEELERAKQMEVQGAAAEEIHSETGWFRFSSGDNLWRHETDDKSLSFSHEFLDYLDDGSNEPVCIKDVFKDNPIMDSYHDFWNVYVIPMGDSPYGEMQGHNGFMNKHGSNGAVEINLKLGERSLVDLKASLLHELQHVIQRIEGMAVGGNRTMFRDLNLLKEERVQSVDAMSVILRNNPEFYDDLAVVQAKLIQLYQYGDGMDLDWDNVPEEIADEYFDSIDVLSKKYPELESDYYDLHDLASRHEFSFGSKQHITPLEQYYQLAGEVEAFQVSDRVGLSMDERRNKLPRMMPRSVVGGLSPIVEFDSKKLVEKAWIEHHQINHRVVEDISRYSSDHFSRITSNKFAELDDLMSSVSNSFLTMMADVTEGLPEDNPLVIDFNKTTAWLGTTPREFRNMCYMSRRPFEKKFNQGLVNYLSEDPKHHPLRGVFSTVTDWMRAILEKLEGKLFEVEVSAEMKSVYENIFGEGGVDLESPFQKKLRSGLRDATNMSMDAELAVAAIMDSGYGKIAERAGIPKGDLAEKYSIEFIRGKEPKPPKLEDGQLKTPATMCF